MRILIFGGDGMLGHVLLRELENKHEVKVTLRNNLGFYEKFNLFNSDNSFDEMDPLNTYGNCIFIITFSKEFDPAI